MRINLLTMAVLTLLLAGCMTSTSTVTEFDAAGHVVKKTVTNDSVVKSLTMSTKDKTVVAWESGWAAYLSASTATNDDPTPHVKIFAGKTDKGVISALSNQGNWDGIAGAINATKYDLSVTSQGVQSGRAK